MDATYTRVITVRMISFTNTSLGLEKNHSTQHTIITLVDRITSSLDSGDLVI